MSVEQQLAAWLGPSPWTWVTSATAFAVALSATPGPNNTMVAASGANFGFRRSLPHIWGVCLGFGLMFIIIGLGGGGALQRLPVVHFILKWVASAYLVWLAWKIGSASGAFHAAAATARPLSFLQAALFQWVNPKAWLAAVSAVSVYTSPSRPVAPEALALSAIFIAVSLPSVSLWTGIGAGAARLASSPRALKIFNLVMAALLLGSVVSLLVER